MAIATRPALVSMPAPARPIHVSEGEPPDRGSPMHDDHAAQAESAAPASAERRADAMPLPGDARRRGPGDARPMRRPTTTKSTRRGQALVEFTLVAGLLLMLLIGIIQFGIAYSNQEQITDASREGARRAVINRSQGQVGMVNAGITAARNAASSLDQGQLLVDVSSQTGTWGAGDAITVKVEYPYDISILGLVVKSGNLSAETTMRAE